MDEAWVGIAGVAGTLFGTLGASWFGIRQARGQAAEARAEAERQRQFESAKDLRDVRRQAYAKYLGQVHRENDALDAFSSTASGAIRPRRSCRFSNDWTACVPS